MQQETIENELDVPQMFMLGLGAVLCVAVLRIVAGIWLPAIEAWLAVIAVAIFYGVSALLIVVSRILTRMSHFQ